MNDRCASAIDVSATPFSGSLDSTANTNDTSVNPSCADWGDAQAHKPAWYKFRNSGSQPLAVEFKTNAAASYYHAMSVWTGTCGALTQILCLQDSYSGNGEDLFFIIPAGQTYYVLITDWDSDAGGTLTFDVTAAVSPSTVIVGTSRTSSEPTVVVMDSTNGDLLAQLDLFAGATGISELGSVWHRPNGNLLFMARETLYEATRNLVPVTFTTFTNPTPPLDFWDTSAFSLDAAGNLFIWYGGFSTNLHNELQKRDPSTLAIVDSWYDVIPYADAFGGIGVVSKDGTKFYYRDGTIYNTIKVLDLNTSVISTFGSYGLAWDGASPSNLDGPIFFQSMRALSDGKLLCIYTSIRGGTTVAEIAVLFNADGTVNASFTLTTAALGGVSGIELTPDETAFWWATSDVKLGKWTLTGTQLFAGPTIVPSQSLRNIAYTILTSSIVPTPPTTPPSALVNSNACCGAKAGGPPSAGPVEPPIDAAWIPSCTGGGLVPTVADLTLAELWDY